MTFEIDAETVPAAAATAMSAEALLSQKSDRLVDGDARIPILAAEQLNGSPRAPRTKSSKPLTLLPLVALIFYDVSGGPFGIEVITKPSRLPGRFSVPFAQPLDLATCAFRSELHLCFCYIPTPMSLFQSPSFKLAAHAHLTQRNAR